MIAEPIQSWVILGTIPTFSSPLILRGKSPSKGIMDLHEAGKKPGAAVAGGAVAGGGGAGGAPRQGKKAAGRPAQAADGDPPGWHRELPSDECVKDWRLPSGKKLADFFGPHKKENLMGLPKVVHHKSGRPAQPCLRYQLEKCRQGAGCPFAHIRPKDMPRDVHDAITSHIKGVYQPSVPHGHSPPRSPHGTRCAANRRVPLGLPSHFGPTPTIVPHGHQHCPHGNQPFVPHGHSPP